MFKASINLILWNQEKCQIFNSSQKMFETLCQQKENCCQNFADQNNITLQWCQNTSNYNCQTEKIIAYNKKDYVLMGLVIFLGVISLISFSCLFYRSKTTSEIYHKI